MSQSFWATIAIWLPLSMIAWHLGGIHTTLRRMAATADRKGERVASALEKDHVCGP